VDGNDFFAMGGYAFYVWSSFGFAALVMAALLAQSWLAARGRSDELERLRRRVRGEGARPESPDGPSPGLGTE
jgi:heme exporter protein D